MKVGIIGIGMVGGALKYWFDQNTDHELKLYDPDKGLQDPMSGCKFIFICVPAPTGDGWNLELHNVKKAILGAPSEAVFLVRTTVLPGTCARLSNDFNRIIVPMPEFLCERSADMDMIENPFLLGSKDLNVDGLFPSNKKIIRVSSFEAELAKYAHNGFAGVKVNYFNIIKHICEQNLANYDNVLEGAFLTGFINKQHTKVPGPDGYYGFGGNCIPKDLKALAKFTGRQSLKDAVSENTLFRLKETRDD